MEVKDPNEAQLLQSDKSSSDYYWNSYAHFSIHEQMLKDRVRTLSYKRAILDNKHIFKDKIVLDVGCGTGILSMFAAQAGAKHVYAVDSSDIIHQATQIIKDNNFGDQITCLQGKMEDIILPVESVDVIISEWMGYFLLYESMLPTVLKARDRWLKKGGAIFPDHANLFLACLEDQEYKEQKIEYWNNVYGFNFSCIQNMAYREPLVDTVNSNAVITTPSKILVATFFMLGLLTQESLDLNTCKVEDLTFKSPFRCVAEKNDNAHCFIAWFDITFACCHKTVYFSTSPSDKYTHWKQVVFYLRDTLTLRVGEEVKGEIEVAPNANNERDLDIKIRVDFKGKLQTLNCYQEYILR